MSDIAKVKGQQLEIEKIVVTPITVRTMGHPDHKMWQAHIYSCVYDAPILSGKPSLSPSAAVLRAWLAATGGLDGG